MREKVQIVTVDFQFPCGNETVHGFGCSLLGYIQRLAFRFRYVRSFEYDIEVFLLKRPKKKASLVVDLICNLPDKWEDVICEHSAVVYVKLNICPYLSNQ